MVFVLRRGPGYQNSNPSNDCRITCPISESQWLDQDDRQCWKFRQSEADNFGGGLGTFCWFSFNLMFMIWDSNHEDLQLFDWVSNTDDRVPAYWFQWCMPEAYLSKLANPSLTKLRLNFNGSLAKLGFTSSVQNRPQGDIPYYSCICWCNSLNQVFISVLAPVDLGQRRQLGFWVWVAAPDEAMVLFYKQM